MSELDRRIAEEVMGEPEPKDLDFEELDGDLWPSVSDGGNWWCIMAKGWTPFGFSSNLEYAMKAVDKALGEVEEELWLDLTYYPPLSSWMADLTTLDGDSYEEEAYNREGASAPEAICNLLLALREAS